MLLLPITSPSADIFERLLRVIASINSSLSILSMISPSPLINSTKDRLPSVIVPVLSLNKTFIYAESENAALWLTRIFFLCMDSVFIDCTKLFIIGRPSGTTMITIVAISITASVAVSSIKDKVRASGFALISVSTICKTPTTVAATTPILPIPAATTSSLRLEVSFLSSSLSSVRALLILPSSESSPITVATI